MPSDAPESTAIVFLTPEAEPHVGAFYREHSNAGRDGMTPHVTLVVPFAPAGAINEDIGHRLRRVLRRFDAFDYDLRRFEYFESGVLYLAPEPSRPLIDLVLALAAEFPDYPPYEGIHDEVIPHVTVAESANTELVRQIKAEIEPRLPIQCRASEVTLVERGTDLHWRPRASIPLGSLE